MEAAGIELTAETPEKQGVPTDGAAKCAAVPDADPLAALLATMTPDQKKRLAELLVSGG